MRYGIMLIALAGVLALATGQQMWAQTPADAPPTVEKPAGDTPKAAPGTPGDGDTTKEPSTQKKTPAPKGGLKSMTPLLIMVGGFILLYMWMGRGRKKRQRKRREMLEAIKKGDKVTTIGGIIGTAIEVRDDEVTVKVDETGNVRMKFTRWAIRGVGEIAKAEDQERAQREGPSSS